MAGLVDWMEAGLEAELGVALQADLGAQLGVEPGARLEARLGARGEQADRLVMGPCLPVCCQVRKAGSVSAVSRSGHACITARAHQGMSASRHACIKARRVLVGTGAMGYGGCKADVRG